MLLQHHSPEDLPVLKLQKPVRRISLEAYLRREERNEGRGERYEFFDGKLKKVPMAKGPHNIVIPNVATALNIAFEKHGIDAVVMSGQQKIYSIAENLAVYPDLLVICEEPKYFDDGELLLINPLLIVEVASPSTKNYDQKGKFELYKTIDSFREYLLVRPDRFSVESRFREAPRVWRETLAEDSDGSIFLASVGVSISLASIYKKVFKKV